ncbi:hypothetical protein DM02DRAFT_634915 [Periconia macrospinosa]|uniref:Uncharacterized protein n=1 Tax=Periconia macrospinosa TaxID=97972 RepID=A0A2V1D4R9_9PLEO|nr:hypothetical protein DM02DRAFT_634915 [Periconia macrospinosa]
MIHHRTRSDAGERELSSPRSSRAPSFSSDRPSLAGSVSFQMPATVRPAPAYIAASVASQIVTHDQNAQFRDAAGDPGSDDDDDDAAVNALFTEQALSLLNGFLDHLLFAILSTARSPSLTQIRPAITEVLKPRLARDAMATADEELEGLLAGEDEDEFPSRDNLEAPKWNIEKVWKRTRLRIMVYTRLGELEDEDEERYVQQERGLSMDDSDDDEAGLVSWASAIFLTSVIEHIAEQTLLISGQAAYTRVSTKMKKQARQSVDEEEPSVERVVIEDFDVEKLAVNSALGRLWRTWRKRVRSPAGAYHSRGVRSISSFTSLHRRKASLESALDESVQEVLEHEPTETQIAANIPLPLGNNDINEIEVPGLAPTFEEEDEETPEADASAAISRRPNSVIISSSVDGARKRLAAGRPISMPPPSASAFVMPAELAAPEQAEQTAKSPEDEEIQETEGTTPFETPMERFHSDDDSYIHDEQQEGMDHDDDHEADADMVAFAASTGMGFGMGLGMSSMPPVETANLNRDDDNTDTPTQDAYDGRTQVLESKRMSIEKPGTPGIVRTFSTRSSSLKSPERTPGATPLATPKLEPKSFYDDANENDDISGSNAIGIAHTSNMPIATPSPPVEYGSMERGGVGQPKHPSHGGYVEVLPRQTAAPTSIQVRNTPTPESVPSPVETVVSRKEIQRKEIPRMEAPTSQPRPRDITPPPRVQRSPLPSVEESPNVLDQPTQRSSPSHNSARHASSHRSRDSPVPVAERSARPHALDTGVRSLSGTSENTPVERSPLQRVSSASSSTNRSVGTSILQTGRNSTNSLEGRPRGLSHRMSEEDRQREFDSLVKGDETVKFTLTPQTVRDVAAESSVSTKRPESHKSAASPKTHKPSSSVTVYPRVAADKESAFGSQHLPTRSSSRSKGPIPFSGNKPPTKKILAREPRVKDESMQDIADFIRSTGPAPGQERPVQPFVPFTTKESKQPQPSNPSSSSLGGLGRKISTRKGSSHSHSNSIAPDGPSAKPRVHMEPRSPAGQRSGNDDLIDFIRQGPPGPNNGQPRIPRSVAPFRTTVDSDQFDNMLNDNGTVESAFGSQVSSTSKQSVHTSNSRTDLLPKQKVVQPAYSNTPQNLSGSFSGPAEPVVTKTRRRIKDPYAIDLSDDDEDEDDEDDDLLTALPKNNGHRPPPKRDESMMDFLNSMEPPSNSQPQAFVLSPETIAAAKARAAKANGANTNARTNNPYASQTNAAPPPPPSSSKNSRLAKFGSSSSSPQQPPVSSSMLSNAPRANKPRLQARDASAGGDARYGGSGRSATNDLADFLRNSGPPPSPPPTARKDKEDGGSKRSAARFWRKNKTFGDMP